MVKAYIYGEGGQLLGYLAYAAEPPQVLDFNGRFFEMKEAWQEDSADGSIAAFNYHEITILEDSVDVIYICIGCGRNSSSFWHKCCVNHVTIDGPEVYCQSCVEKLHPGDPEFARS